MGITEVENVLRKDKFMDAEEVAKKVGITSGNSRILLNKLVTKYKTVEMKRELVSHCWKRLYKLKE